MLSTDSIEDNTGFAKKNGATFPVLSDADKSTAKAYGVLAALGYAKRWTFYIDPEGVIVKIDQDTKPATAGADLARTLAELRVPRSTAGEPAEAAQPQQTREIQETEAPTGAD